MANDRNAPTGRRFAGLLALVLIAQCVLFTGVEGRRPRSPSLRDNIRTMGAQGVNMWMMDEKLALEQDSLVLPEEIAGNPDASLAANREGDNGEEQRGEDQPQRPFNVKPSPTTFRARWFRQPLDHFAKDGSGGGHTWHQRYWVNLRHYRPRLGAPVIVIDGGETSGEDRLPFLDTGIAEILARAMGGIGIVLEHRYYGESLPVSNLTTDSLRWLNNAQSAADSANFMENLELDDVLEDITAPNTPWIYYGGSYAGARAAHMRILYPELVYGAIASSAVTHAELSNWRYMDIIRRAADPTCSENLVNAIKTIDGILQHPRFSRPLKALFGLAGLEHDDDFASVLEIPLGSWQDRNWDPEVGSTNFEEFCATLSGHHSRISQGISSLPFGHPDRSVRASNGLKVDFVIWNYAKWIREHVVHKCKERTVEDCFGTYDDSRYQVTTLDQTWRLWLFQVCTEWGYFTTPPPDRNHPSIISRLLTLEYESKICRQAFPDGEHFRIPSMPNITVVNELGDFDIAADRLAFIDGEVDPWRPDTPHAEEAYDREDTLLRPFKVIPGGVHHWDENGLENILDEPPEIRKIHGEIVYFVREWLGAWAPPYCELISIARISKKYQFSTVEKWALGHITTHLSPQSPCHFLQNCSIKYLTETLELSILSDLAPLQRLIEDKWMERICAGGLRIPKALSVAERLGLRDFQGRLYYRQLMQLFALTQTPSAETGGISTPAEIHQELAKLPLTADQRDKLYTGYLALSFSWFQLINTANHITDNHHSSSAFSTSSCREAWKTLWQKCLSIVQSNGIQVDFVKALDEVTRSLEEERERSSSYRRICTSCSEKTGELFNDAKRKMEGSICDYFLCVENKDTGVV
ncbi:hypothetical protein AX16_004572 [Volvariella volvacea WC 439]|nr:hypothetical protein AX16_004572 [Volvariella volvacea WC 439]